MKNSESTLSESSETKENSYGIGFNCNKCDVWIPVAAVFKSQIVYCPICGNPNCYPWRQKGLTKTDDKVMIFRRIVFSLKAFDYLKELQRHIRHNEGRLLSNNQLIERVLSEHKLKREEYEATKQ